MLKNYLLVACRNLIRNKGFSTLNISGLAIGMASAMLILVWIQHEISYDRFHPNEERLYEAYSSNTEDGKLRANVPTPQLLGPAMKHDYPEVAEATRVGWTNYTLLAYQNRSLKEKGTWADPSFLTMFGFPLLQGNPATALKDPYSLVITEKLAGKLFGKSDPMGKTIRLDNNADMRITGILKNLPDNTDFDFEYLQSSEFLNARHQIDSDWTDISTRTFVLLKQNAAVGTFNVKIKDIDSRYSGGASTTTTFLYPVRQLHLYSLFENNVAVGGRIDTVRTFAVIAGFILLIACINFMNLSTARSEKRAREVGIRKVVGARRISLIAQFLGESLLLACIAGVLALLIVQVTLPAFNTLTGKTLSLEYSNASRWMAFGSFILFTGLLAGSYPAFMLSAFKPAAVLKGSFRNIGSWITPRKVLVILQFTFAIVLIVGTLIVRKQIEYARLRNSGYDKNNLIYVYMEGDIGKQYQLIKNDLLHSGAALELSQTLSPLTEVWSGGIGLKWDGKNPNIHYSFDRSNTSGNLVKTAGFQLLMGRDIDPEKYPTDSTGCLINESAAKIMGFKNPLGKRIFDDPIYWHVVGVIKDFILTSPFQATKPIIFKGPAYGSAVMNIRLNNRFATEDNLAKASAIFKKYNPAYPFEYHFLDEEYAHKFNDEKLTGSLATLFSGLTIFISCLGLLGLASYMAQNRMKEIGVRKVLGASVGNISFLLSKDILQLILIAAVIATPIAWFAGNHWLSSYQYRIAISYSIFIRAGLLAMVIGVCTVGYQALKAALANPVHSLRSE